ncbi:hypothetical protein AYM40_26795 [Paraburkholderia phytofirmans OLGA172]|uniref:PAC domain-containing protein n=2 Tax=Paraburkholderia phytofirmans TaxID=261302 RepID=A0A167WDB6_9BURK|nr:hypothetical protein AYM40_26795 [Paraburkholderia phytofirmans OLGA172]
MEDLSDKKRAEDQIRRANQRLELSVARRTLNLRMSNEALRADIDRRRAAQTLSAESREKYHALFRHLPLGLLVCDASGDITEANRTFQQYLGANTRAALEQGLSDPTRVIKADADTVP